MSILTMRTQYSVLHDPRYIPFNYFFPRFFRDFPAVALALFGWRFAVVFLGFFPPPVLTFFTLFFFVVFFLAETLFFFVGVFLAETLFFFVGVFLASPLFFFVDVFLAETLFFFVGVFLASPLFLRLAPAVFFGETFFLVTCFFWLVAGGFLDLGAFALWCGRSWCLLLLGSRGTAGRGLTWSLAFGWKGFGCSWLFFASSWFLWLYCFDLWSGSRWYFLYLG